MIINFLSQIILFLLFLLVVHGGWVYIQEHVLKKNNLNNLTVTSSQIQKYEQIIDDLREQQSESQTTQETSNNIEQELEHYVDSLL